MGNSGCKPKPHDVSFFFIAGLPRSRTAWLANWFTTDTSICLHDAWRYARDVKELRSILEAVALSHPQYKYVGTSDSCNGWFYPELKEEFPEARFGLVCRALIESTLSIEKWLRKAELPEPIEGLDKRLINLQYKHNCLIEEADVSLSYMELNSIDKMKKFQAHLTPILRFSPARFALLDGLQVEINIPKYKSSLAHKPMIGNGCLPEGLLP